MQYWQYTRVFPWIQELSWESSKYPFSKKRTHVSQVQSRNVSRIRLGSIYLEYILKMGNLFQVIFNDYPWTLSRSFPMTDICTPPKWITIFLYQPIPETTGLYRFVILGSWIPLRHWLNKRKTIGKPCSSLFNDTGEKGYFQTFSEQ